MIPDMISAGWKWIERGAAHLWPVSLELIVAATLLLLIAAVMHLGLAARPPRCGTGFGP